MKDSTKSPSTGDGGAWARFERAVDAAVKSGPIHEKPAPKGVTKKERPASKGRVLGEGKKSP